MWGKTLLRTQRGHLVLRVAWIPISAWYFRFFLKHGLIFNVWRLTVALWWNSTRLVED